MGIRDRGLRLLSESKAGLTLCLLQREEMEREANEVSWALDWPLTSRVHTIL